jgi:hypothetical protein
MPARVLLLVVVTATASAADPVAVRHPEGAAYGTLAVEDDTGRALADGELVQWLRGSVVMSRLTFHFDDGSLYDELVGFTQRRVFRVVSYHLVQRGPSFTESTDVTFDAGGAYRVRRRASPEQDEEEASGHFDVPEDVTNGMTSILLKNLMPDRAATTHLVAFRPKPLVMELHLSPEGIDRYRMGPETRVATRFRIEPEVTGVKGALASLTGKQPPALRMWIARVRAPALVKFEGPLYTEGPPWRIGPSHPRW